MICIDIKQVLLMGGYIALYLLLFISALTILLANSESDYYWRRWLIYEERWTKVKEFAFWSNLRYFTLKELIFLNMHGYLFSTKGNGMGENMTIQVYHRKTRAEDLPESLKWWKE